MYHYSLYSIFYYHYKDALLFIKMIEEPFSIYGVFMMKFYSIIGIIVVSDGFGYGKYESTFIIKFFIGWKVWNGKILSFNYVRMIFLMLECMVSFLS